MLTTWLSLSSSFRLAKKSSNSEVQSTLLTEVTERKREMEIVKEETEDRRVGGGGERNKLDSLRPQRNVLQEDIGNILVEM